MSSDLPQARSSRGSPNQASARPRNPAKKAAKTKKGHVSPREKPFVSRHTAVSDFDDDDDDECAEEEKRNEEVIEKEKEKKKEKRDAF